MNTSTLRTHLCVLAAALTIGGHIAANAAAPALQGQLVLRPVTPQDIKDYTLTGAQVASGLSTVPLGTPAHLEALVNYNVPDSGITNVSWTLTSKPLGSAATLTTSPLGTNVPTYRMADRMNQSGVPTYKVAGRTMLRPDVRGQYTVTLAIETSASGTTNLTQTITAGTYMGIDTCALCHSGGIGRAPNKVTPWSETLHATKFTRGINGFEGDHYSGSCIKCHTVGYDTDTNAVNGGFDDIAKQLGWTFPAVLNTNNWDAVPSSLKNLANIQCENCHGPGSEHAFALGDTNKITVNFNAGTCAQCHDSKNNHVKSAEWNNSIHARATRTPTGPGRDACARCHTGGGYAAYTKSLAAGTIYTTNNADTTYTAITCSTCHEPHDATNPHQLRASPIVKLSDGTVVTNAGLGGFCMSCHQIRNGPAASNISNYQNLRPTWAGGSSFGVHDGPQGEMLEGTGAITYGKILPSAAHRYAVTNTCVGCHMQAVATTDPGFTKVGGHTFNMDYQVVNNGVTNTVDMVNVCAQCHGPIDSFDMAKQDYDGDGVIDGVQTEVQHLLDRLSRLLPNSTYRADGNYVADGLVKSPSVKTNWPAKYLNAAYNWQFVNNDGSKGIHNAPYAVGLLKAAIADLTGDSNSDSLPDAWQIQYFGSCTSSNAAPSASPAGDGIPNWLKYSLGLDPMKPGLVVPDGVVWANNGQMGGGTNSLHIYTAAEVSFETEVGKTYQVQGISGLSGTWQNIGGPITGTGSALSYVTPMRKNVQQYFRVVTQ